MTVASNLRYVGDRIATALSGDFPGPVSVNNVQFVHFYGIHLQITEAEPFINDSHLYNVAVIFRGEYATGNRLYSYLHRSPFGIISDVRIHDVQYDVNYNDNVVMQLSFVVSLETEHPVPVPGSPEDPGTPIGAFEIDL